MNAIEEVSRACILSCCMRLFAEASALVCTAWQPQTSALEPAFRHPSCNSPSAHTVPMCSMPPCLCAWSCLHSTQPMQAPIYRTTGGAGLYGSYAPLPSELQAQAPDGGMGSLGGSLSAALAAALPGESSQDAAPSMAAPAPEMVGALHSTQQPLPGGARRQAMPQSRAPGGAGGLAVLGWRTVDGRAAGRSGSCCGARRCLNGML